MVEVKKEDDIWNELADRLLIPFDSCYDDFTVIDWDNGFELLNKETDLPICAVHILEE